VENAVYIANELDIPLLYISTAGIFDGKKEIYDDGISLIRSGFMHGEIHGERFVVENAKRYLVCRAGWMMGAGPKKDKKFIQKLMKQLKEGKKELLLLMIKTEHLPLPTIRKNVKALIRKEYWVV